MFDESLLTLFGVAFEDLDSTTSDEILLDKLLSDLDILKCDYEFELVKPKMFIFPSNVENTESVELTEAGISILKDFMHVGIVNKKTAVEPLKKNAVLMIVKPSFVSLLAYQDRHTYLGGTKKVRTMIFSVSETVYNKVQSGEIASQNDIIAAAAMSAEVKDWKFFETEVMSAFYHMITEPNSKITQVVLKKIWRELPTTSLDSFWRQLLFLCCGPNNIGYHVKEMLIRNSERIEKLIQDEAGKLNLERQAISEYKILYLLVEWTRFSGDMVPIMLTLKEINATTEIMEPSAILQKIQLAFASQAAVSKRHRCNYCKYQTDMTTDLRRHVRKHTGEKPFSCEICDKSFAQKISLQRHISSHQAIVSFSCNLCGQTFVKRDNLLFHLKRHEQKGETTHKCYACKKEFLDEDALKAHMLNHKNDKKFNCKICSERFSTKQERMMHRNALHAKLKKYKCRYCLKKFMEEDTLRRHLITHKPKKFSCDYCGKAFAVNTARVSHQFHQHEKEHRKGLLKIAEQSKAEDLSTKK